MISALRNNPNSFEFTRGSLHHIPSRHTFQFDRNGHVHLDAECGCSLLAVSNDQESALVEAFSEWRINYWRPLEINRQFAEHFNPPSGWRRLLIGLTARLHRALLKETHKAHEQKQLLSVGG